MALFKKKEKKEDVSEIPKLPEIPQLPELPEFPETERENDFMNKKFEFSEGKMSSEMQEPLPQLPSFPSGSLGDKFSQNTIKEAITGRKEEEAEAEEFTEEMPMMQKPLIRETPMRNYPQLQRTKPKEAEPSDFANASRGLNAMSGVASRSDFTRVGTGMKERSHEPIFIRIDKFEEGSRTFEEVKTKISEIENMFDDIKNVREKEEKELALWENEIKQVKEKIEKIDSNIFSQIE